jgi:hypothetical protein
MGSPSKINSPSKKTLTGKVPFPCVLGEQFVEGLLILYSLSCAGFNGLPVISGIIYELNFTA